MLGVHLLNVQRILVIPHALRDGVGHPRRLRARVGESAGQDVSWQTFGVVSDQRQALEDDVRKVGLPPADPGDGRGRRLHLRRRHGPARARR